MDAQLQKKAIRKEVLQKRACLNEEDRKCAAFLLEQVICSQEVFLEADILLTFVNYGSEIDVTGIIENAFKYGKKVYVPKVEGDELQFYNITDLNCLQVGYKGIREPAGNTECYQYNPEEADRVLMLMPGVVFDRRGNRCGYGKGFYDRYLADKEALQKQTVGVGFQCQLVEELPFMGWDIRPGRILCV